MGSLPIDATVREEARRRGIELTVMPTAEACAVLADADRDDVYAALHVAC